MLSTCQHLAKKCFVLAIINLIWRNISQAKRGGHQPQEVGPEARTGKPVCISHVLQFLYAVFAGIPPFDVKSKINLSGGHVFKVAGERTDVHAFAGRFHFSVKLFGAVPAFGLVIHGADKLLVFDIYRGILPFYPIGSFFSKAL